MNTKYIILTSLVLACFSNGYSQITNAGTLKINSSTQVYFNDEYTNSPTGIHDNDGDLYLNSNFINEGTTISTSGTTYFNSDEFDIQNISGSSNSINFYNLEVNLATVNKKGLLVADHFGLSVANNLSINNGDLRLVGDAQLLQTHSGIDANTIGAGHLLIDQQGVSSNYAFNYWSSPVKTSGSYTMLNSLFDGTDDILNPFSPQNVLFITSGSHNGVPSNVDGGGNVTTPLSINKTWLYKHNQPSSWALIDENTSLSPGIGYTMKGTGSVSPTQNYVFKGNANNGLYQIPVVTGENVLIGNPFPSAIDSAEFITDNSTLFDGTLYFWVDGGSTSHYTSNYLGGYAIRNLVTGAPPSVPADFIGGLGNANLVPPPTQYIDVAQGFFIITNGNGNLIFKNSQRALKNESSGSVNFYRAEDENSIIRIGYEDPEGFHRQLALGFIPNSPADLDYNPGYDALMIDAREDELFFIIENDNTKKYVIQGVGMFDDTMEFPLGLIISETGEHTIMLDAVENFDSPVYIKDTLLNMTYDLNEGEFMPSLPIGEYFDRFRIVFIPQTLQINEYLKNNINVFYSNNYLVINNPNFITINKIKILNTLGQTIQTHKQNSTDNRITIPFNLNDGLYLINVESLNKETTYKIIKN